MELQIKSNNIIGYLNAPISPESNEEEIFTGNSIIRWRGGSDKPPTFTIGLKLAKHNLQV